MINDLVNEKKNQGINHFEYLAKELILSIFKFLDNKDFPNTSLVCRKFNSLNSAPITLYWRMTQEPDLKKIKKLNHLITDSHFEEKTKKLLQDRSISLLKESLNMKQEAYLLREQTPVLERNQIDKLSLINDMELFNASNLLEYLRSFCDCLKDAFIAKDPVNVYGMSSMLTHEYLFNFEHFQSLMPENHSENTDDIKIEVAKMSFEYFNQVLEYLNQSHDDHHSYYMLDEQATQPPPPQENDRNEMIQFFTQKLNEVESFLNTNALTSKFKSLTLT